MLSRENREQSRTESMEGTEHMQVLPQFLTVKCDGRTFDKRDVWTYSGGEIMFTLDCVDMGLDFVIVRFDTEGFVTNKDGSPIPEKRIYVTREGTLVKVSPVDKEQKTCSFSIMETRATRKGMHRDPRLQPCDPHEGDGIQDGATGTIIINNPRCSK